MQADTIKNQETQENINIRTLKVPEDGSELAKLFNAFNKIWDGGFVGEGKNTSEMALDIVTRTKTIDTYVAEDASNHLVGYCSLHPHYRDKDACYVGILGVHPDVLGKKVGKRLMLKSLEKAVQEGYYRLDLGTWAGNMKAMPLYKKLGLMWVPETSVQMEDYIPLILSNPLFEKFWLKYPDWYSIFKKEITQAEDKDKKGNLHVYTYSFACDEDKLTVWIDRFAKTMIGFDFIFEGDQISISLDASSNDAYRGVEFPLSIIINSNQEINNCSITPELPVGTNLNELDEIPPIIQSTTINGLINIETSAKLYKKDYKGLTPKFNLKFNGNKKITLGIGLKIKSAIEIKPSHKYEVLRLNYNPKQIEIIIENNLEHNLQGKLQITNENNISFNEREIPINLSNKGNNLVKLEIQKLVNQGMTAFECQVEYNTLGEHSFSSITELFNFELPILTLDKQYVIENKRKKNLKIYNGDYLYQVDLRGGELKSNAFNGSIFQAQAIDEGKAFGFNEFRRLLYSWESKLEDSYLILTLSVKSEERPGLKLIKTIKFLINNPLIEIKYDIINQAEFDYSLNLRSYQGSNNNPNRFYHVIPFMNEIIKTDGLYAPRNIFDFGTDLSAYHESWVSLQISEGPVCGVIWKQNEPYSIRLDMCNLDFHVDVKSKSKTTFGTVWLYLDWVGDWKVVRKLWLNNFGLDYVPDFINQESRDIFEINLLSSKFNDDKNYEIKIELKTVLLTDYSGKFKLSSPDQSYEFQHDIDNFICSREKPFFFNTSLEIKEGMQGKNIPIIFKIITDRGILNFERSIIIPINFDHQVS
ncbi:MAG: GNAT family N-acetyltransferase, partial [Candidatus Hodarchaeales archaeon]